MLEKHSMRLRGFEAELSSELRDVPSSENKTSEPAASGVREYPEYGGEDLRPSDSC